MLPAASPLSARVTASVVSVQILPPRSTAPELTTVASTMTGDFATSCASVGRMIVVACAAAPAIIRTHVAQYTRKCFKRGSLDSTEFPRSTPADKGAVLAEVMGGR